MSCAIKEAGVTSAGNSGSIAGRILTETAPPSSDLAKRSLVSTSVGGLNVVLYLALDSAIDSVVSTDSGLYIFNDLDSGKYSIRVFDGDSLVLNKENLVVNAKNWDINVDLQLGSGIGGLAPWSTTEKASKIYALAESPISGTIYFNYRYGKQDYSGKNGFMMSKPNYECGDNGLVVDSSSSSVLNEYRNGKFYTRDEDGCNWAGWNIQSETDSERIFSFAGETPRSDSDVSLSDCNASRLGIPGGVMDPRKINIQMKMTEGNLVIIEAIDQFCFMEQYLYGKTGVLEMTEASMGGTLIHSDCQQATFQVGNRVASMKFNTLTIGDRIDSWEETLSIGDSSCVQTKQMYTSHLTCPMEQNDCSGRYQSWIQ
jgi:hypothetical protein